jgi:ABC-type microcin C transport system permease subunit YejB
MARLQSLTFKRLMDESEQALWRADCLPDYYRLPLRQVLHDCTRYHSWEVSHARLMRQVARAGQPIGQAFSLREATVRMIHRRGLFDYLRTHKVRGAARKRLFEVFYGPMDFREAVLCEHRQYVLAASSGYCGEVLVESIHDNHGLGLLNRYEEVYRDYFEVFGRFVTAEVTGERDLVSVLRPAMLQLRVATNRLRAQILTHGYAWQLGNQAGARPHRSLMSA